MAADGFAIHPDDLRSTAPAFTTEGDTLHKALTALQATMAGLGAPWGDDDQGKVFANGDGTNPGFVPAQESLFKALGVMAQGIASMDPALRALADNTTAQDQSNAAAYKQ
ncbi:hypothetical protein [Yinghuangia seranimata]|uniref:hypothetical protein n=1 Tax=Yinghuangia seranimata TaxID=408067 RepID=UPI00248AB1C7|nr:hypothetical protein [Yinghuangia seranimata]MDI2132184.1 hypothetical protein [Yinghuangia seranimata]